jgi:hypothetical protein
VSYGTQVEMRLRRKTGENGQRLNRVDPAQSGRVFSAVLAPRLAAAGQKRKVRKKPHTAGSRVPGDGNSDKEKPQRIYNFPVLPWIKPMRGALR